MQQHSVRRIALIFFAGALLITLLSSGFTEFNTKGEPREALVAHTMLSTGDWVLPVDEAGDMSYKPPMFHWLVAASSLLFGSLSEFTSRLPSALALSGLVTATFRFFVRRREESSAKDTDTRQALLAALLTFTCFECFRAGTNCRVDMVLTFFMCTAIMALVRGIERRSVLRLGLGALLLSGAALTKGPVGIVLPLGVVWVYALLQGRNFLKVTAVALIVLIAACLLPALWYYAAWRHGGDRFLSLAMEENFGRFTGQMTYDSHVKPFWYNFVSLLTGTLPWSLLLICTLRPRRWRIKAPRLSWAKIRQADPYTLLSVTAAVLIFIFYCIPKSKRSVYLLPMYPFIGYLLAERFMALIRERRLSAKLMRRLVTIVLILYPIGYAIVFPFSVNGRSDRAIAEDISQIVPDKEPVYTFVPDAFLRYYVTNHYLGYRMKSLLPSGQTPGADRTPEANDIAAVPGDCFYLALSEKVWDGRQIPLSAEGGKETDFGIHSWLTSRGLEAEEIYRSERSTRDVKGRLVLLKVASKTGTEKYDTNR